MTHVTHTQPEIEPADAAQIDKRLAADPRITHVALVHCETTTGMLNPRGQDRRRSCAAMAGMFILDAMSSFAGMPIDAAEVGADYLISSANKCVQGVPGFGFVIARRADLERAPGGPIAEPGPVRPMARNGEPRGQVALHLANPRAVGPAPGARSSSDAEGGVAARYARYAENHRVLVEGLTRLGLSPAAAGRTSVADHHVVSLSARRPLFVRQDVQALKRRGFLIYPGKVSHADTFRVGTIGHVFPDDFRRLVGCFAEVVSRVRLAGLTSLAPE